MNIRSLPYGLAYLLSTCILFVGLVTSAIPIASAQSEESKTVSTRAKASFRIEPLVQRFKGRRGEVIPFSFQITATGQDMDVVLTPTSLRQEENGLIMPREGDAGDEALRLLSPLEFKVKSGESRMIDGEVKIPLAKSNFLSFGILVKDRGQLTKEGSENVLPGETQAAIRFVTQYLLRIDIETGVQDFAELRRLTLEKGTIRAINGEPLAQLYLVNPTNFALECFVQGTIESSQEHRPQPFYFGLPSRRELPKDKRNLVRVMPNSRLRLEADVESLLFPGRQTLHVKLTNGIRGVIENSFDLDVREGDFPGLEAKLAYIGNELSVEPAQIEFSTVARTARTRTLIFHNNSNSTKVVHLTPHSLTGEPMPGLKLSTDTFDIKAGRSKSIRLTIENDGAGKSIYGRLEIRLNGQDDEEELTDSLPVALLYRPPVTPNVEITSLRAIEVKGHTSFDLSVTNHSEGYVPVHGRLQVSSRQGRTLTLADGFGRWISPGETRLLRFAPEESLPAGDYQLQLKVTTVAEATPMTKTTIITLSPGATESISSLEQSTISTGIAER